MGIQHEKYELPVLSQIITQTFGDFRSRARPGDNLLALFALSAAPTAAFWWLSQPTVPRSNGPFGIFRPCNRPGGACQEACVSPFPPIGTFRSFASPACRTSAGSAPGPTPSGGNPRPRNGTDRGPRGRTASFWHFRPLGRPGGRFLAAFRNHRPRQRQSSWRFSFLHTFWRQSFSAYHPCTRPPQADARASGRGSQAKKEAAWGRRQPLGRGTCALKGTRAWGALC